MGYVPIDFTKKSRQLYPARNRRFWGGVGQFLTLNVTSWTATTQPQRTLQGFAGVRRLIMGKQRYSRMELFPL
jgi:hypothetical protein